MRENEYECVSTNDRMFPKIAIKYIIVGNIYIKSLFNQVNESSHVFEPAPTI